MHADDDWNVPIEGDPEGEVNADMSFHTAHKYNYVYLPGKFEATKNKCSEP